MKMKSLHVCTSNTQKCRGFLAQLVLDCTYTDIPHTVHVIGMRCCTAYRLLWGRGHVSAIIACVPNRIQIKDELQTTVLLTLGAHAQRGLLWSLGSFFSVCLFHQYLTCSTSRSQNEGINLDYTCESRRKIICFV